MRILALILARGGSKRLPGKNIRMLGGKPMIAWSIDVVKDLPEVCDILVSTDDPSIAAVCKTRGAYVPWLRPEELATDTATSIDATLHALDWYESRRGAVDGILLLQPTSPFRTVETVCRGIELFDKSEQQTVLGVSPTHAHPMWTFKFVGKYIEPWIQNHGLSTRSQDLPPAYIVNGSFYLSSPSTLRAENSFFSKKLVPLLIKSEREALDIDSLLDFKIAEAMLLE